MPQAPVLRVSVTAAVVPTTVMSATRSAAVDSLDSDVTAGGPTSTGVEIEVVE